MKKKDIEINHDDKIDEENELDKVKNHYSFLIETAEEDGISYDILNRRLYFSFPFSLKDKLFEKQLIEVKSRINSYSGNINIEEDRNKINDIINERKNVQIKAKEIYDFYNELLGKLVLNYKEKKVPKSMHKNACDDIIKSIINNYIKLEKKLINIKDKLKNLSLNF